MALQQYFIETIPDIS